MLAYFGRSLSEDEADRICLRDREGAVVELAVEGLSDAGFDAELRQFGGIAGIEEALDADQPVIAVLEHPVGWLHAVVVCDVSSGSVVFMDPTVGEYVTLVIPRFLDMWRWVQHEGLLVGGTQLSAPSRPG